MAKLSIKNISGNTISFNILPDLLDEEEFVAIENANLGPEFENILKEWGLNTIQLLAYDGDLEILLNDNPLSPDQSTFNLVQEYLDYGEVVLNKPLIWADSVQDQIINSTIDGDVVVFETVIDSNFMDIVNGEITAQKKGIYIYDMTLNLDVVGGFSSILENWWEYYDGTNWVPYPLSAKKKDFSTISEGYINYHGFIKADEDAKFRHKIRATGAGAMLKADTVANGTVVVSASITINAL